MKLKHYKVQLTSHSSWTVWAQNATNAKRQVWRKIRGGFAFGYKSEADLVRRAKVTRLD